MTENVDRKLITKKSAELLMSGAVMLPSHCPKCGAPLFKLKTGDIVCPIHGKVIIAKSEEDIAKASTESVLVELEKIVAERIAEICRFLRDRTGKEDDARLASDALQWLNVLEKIENIRKIRGSLAREEERKE